MTSAADILAIDDDETVLEVTASILGSAGFGVRTAVRGPAGIEAYRSQRPDVVLLDIGMFPMDGWVVLRELLAFDPGARVLIHSGDRGHTERVKTSGALGFVVKNLEPKELTAAVRAALATPRPKG
jgi:DNA-binding response OmpR family regulator